MTLRALITVGLISASGCASSSPAPDAPSSAPAATAEIVAELTQAARLLCDEPALGTMRDAPVWLLWTDFEGPLSPERARALSAAGYRTAGNAALSPGERSYQLVLAPAQARSLAREERGLTFRCNELAQPTPF